MNTELQDLKDQLAQLQRERQQDRRRARLSWTCALAALALTVLLNLRPAALAQSPGVTLASLLTRIQALEQKTTPITVSGTDLTFTGVNVHIVDGNPYGLTDDGTGGETSNTTLTGLGNLIIGYNSQRGGTQDARTGSHNLILGDRNNYSSYGGLVDGYQNEITASGVYSSVLGGRESTVSGGFASITGGYQNTASGEYASVSGGTKGTASGQYASVSGGTKGTASGQFASVSGGGFNTATGQYASVSGGSTNTASGQASSVTGGVFNTAGGELSSVSGGGSSLGGITENNNFGWAAGATGSGTYHSP